MKKLLRHKTGAQSISEYVLLIALASVALIGMQTYMKRGIQGVVRFAADEIGDQRKGSITEGRRGEVRFLPGISSQSRLETVSIDSNKGKDFSGGKMYYEHNYTTRLPIINGEQVPQRIYHEYIYDGD